MVNRSTEKAHFEVVYTNVLRQNVDLVALPRVPRVSQAVENLAEHV